MRQLLALTVITALIASAAMAATDEVTARRICTDKWRSMSATEMGSTRRDDFIFKCMQAHSAASSGGSALMMTKPGADGSMAKKRAAIDSVAAKSDTGGSAK